MRAWWALEIVNMFAFPYGIAKLDRFLSREEKRAVNAIMTIGLIFFLLLMALGEAIFRELKIPDDLDIHVGIVVSLSILLGFWLARCFFVLAWPQLSAQADSNAEKRLRERDPSET